MFLSAVCRASILKSAPSFWLRVTMVSISVIFFLATFRRRTSSAGEPASSTTTCVAATPCARVQNVLAIRPNARGVFPKTVAQVHLDAVFGKSHFFAERQRVRIMRDQSIQVLREEAAQAFAIAIGCRRVARTCANQDQDQEEMFHRV